MHRLGNASADAKADQTREEDEQKSLRLLNWKERIKQPNLKHLSRWVRQRESDCKPVVFTHGDHIAWNRQEATKLIKNYWTEVWKKQDDQRPSFADITNYTVQSFPAELRASPDCLSAEEVRYLPGSIIQVFLP